MNALSTLTILPQTKSEIMAYEAAVLTELQEGYTNPLEFKKNLTALKNTLDALTKNKDIADIVLSEAEKYTEKTFDFLGCKITKKNIARYSYKECQDSEWLELKSKADAANAALKGRESWLKTIETTFIDSRTGETIYAPYKSESEALSITLPK